jgi:hypothetical protein
MVQRSNIDSGQKTSRRYAKDTRVIMDGTQQLSFHTPLPSAKIKDKGNDDAYPATHLPLTW